MPNYYRLPLIFSLTLAACNVLAVSKVYHNQLSVILKNGNPCFFAEQGTNLFYGLSVVRQFNYGEFREPPYWESETSEGIPIPTSKESCLLYGKSIANFKVSVEPVPLKINTPYRVIFNTDMRHGVEFCLMKQKESSELILTKIGSSLKQQCTAEPLNEEDKPPSFWKRLFNW